MILEFLYNVQMNMHIPSGVDLLSWLIVKSCAIIFQVFVNMENSVYWKRVLFQSEFLRFLMQKLHSMLSIWIVILLHQ
jgi:hypothetical protein